jgi:hypothetical protein
MKIKKEFSKFYLILQKICIIRNKKQEARGQKQDMAKSKSLLGRHPASGF